MTLHTIVDAEARRDFTVALAFRDGRKGVVDFAPVIARGGVFAALADPARFAAVTIGARGRSLIWTDEAGDDIDFCADALWRQCGGEGPPGVSGAADRAEGAQRAKPAPMKGDRRKTPIAADRGVSQLVRRRRRSA
jgi:hypothetical protein